MADRQEEEEKKGANSGNLDKGAESRLPSASTTVTPSFQGAEKVTADFQCFVCGAIFNTDEDRKQHLEKEAHGGLHGESTAEERKVASEQEKLNEGRPHRV